MLQKAIADKPIKEIKWNHNWLIKKNKEENRGNKE